MKQETGWKVVAVVIVCLIVMASFAHGQDESGGSVKGQARFRYDYFGVNKDDGRFREDQWRTDGSTGGLDWLHLESTGPDKNGYEWLLEGRALHDYDYRMSLLLRKPESHYLKIDFSGLRRYFDGSNEYWNAPVMRLAERSDGSFFVDRRNYNIELGLTPPEGAHWVFGWHRLVKDGKEVLLSGSEETTSEFLGVPNVVNQRGITDTIYGEVFWTAEEKYNFRIRQEVEQYHDKRRGPIAAEFDNTGDLDSDERFLDNLGYTNWRTMFMFDSFLDDQTYVTVNYMYNYLNSDSTRTVWRPALYAEDISVGNSRRTNVAGLGYRKFNICPNLDLSAGIRLEDSKTDSQSLWQYHGGNFYTLKSSLD